jgi:hypothetical protein
MRYAFKCKKCHSEHESESFLKVPECCKKSCLFREVRGTEAMTPEDLDQQAKQLVDSLTSTNKELLEAVELVNSAAIALNLGGSDYRARKKSMKQWLQMKETK